mgnify:CR=1 FL=1
MRPHAAFHTNNHEHPRHRQVVRKPPRTRPVEREKASLVRITSLHEWRVRGEVHADKCGCDHVEVRLRMAATLPMPEWNGSFSSSISIISAFTTPPPPVAFATATATLAAFTALTATNAAAAALATAAAALPTTPATLTAAAVSLSVVMARVSAVAVTTGFTKPGMRPGAAVHQVQGEHRATMVLIGRA